MRTSLSSLFCVGFGVSLALFGGTTTAHAQLVDSSTLLYLNFNGSTTGASGETPTTASSVAFGTGISGSGLSVGDNTVLSYAASNNINAQDGTLEFFFKPSWNGIDLDTHYLASWGSNGGMVFHKDGFPNLRQIVNRFNGEADTAVFGSALSANTWYNIAYTWNNTDSILKLYIDGVLLDTQTFGFSLPSISASDFFIGSDNGFTGFSTAQGVMDEIRISNRERSSTEINDYRNTILASGAAPEAPALPLVALGSLLSGTLVLRRRPTV